jgi:vacuole morphology and inheritance protein 14
MVVLGDQINTVTLDLLFIMDITESMQDLLDETRDSIKYILDKIKRDSPGIDVRFSYEGYRDFADLKEGQVYYTIDFETDMDVFKSKLDEITCIGGGDDAEDVAGGLNAGLNMNWRSNARYAILIADAPGHGSQYHTDEVQDDYEQGDPNGLVLEEIMEKYADNNINLCLTRIDDYTDIMFEKMTKAYKARSEKSTDKPKIEIIEYLDDEEYAQKEKEEQEKKEGKVGNEKKEKKRTMGNLVAKTAIEIYNQYSQKAEKSNNK